MTRQAQVATTVCLILSVGLVCWAMPYHTHAGQANGLDVDCLLCQMIRTVGKILQIGLFALSMVFVLGRRLPALCRRPAAGNTPFVKESRAPPVPPSIL